MARTVATLPAGARITDYISLGVITKTFPPTTVRAVLTASGKASLRERDLPAHVVMYYVIAPGLRRGRLWRFSGRSPIARCCAACWRACNGCAIRRSRSRACPRAGARECTKLGNPLYFKGLRDDCRLVASLAKPLESQDFASEGIEFCTYPSAQAGVAGKSGISQARTRLGWQALRQLHDAVVRPIALPATRGAWYRQWRLDTVVTSY
jgi:hypothetical protein